MNADNPSTNGAPPESRVADVGAQRVAHVYAEALLDAGKSQGQEDELLDELRTLVLDVFAQQPKFEEFLGSLVVGRDRKTDVLRTVFTDRTSPMLFNFLATLNDHDRLGLLRAILREAAALREVRKGRMRVDVRSAAPLPDDQRERLTSELRELFQREPVLDIRIDPEILGGMIVRVGDWLYDASVRTQLRTIRKQLYENADHEIQSGRDRFSN